MGKNPFKKSIIVLMQDNMSNKQLATKLIEDDQPICSDCGQELCGACGCCANPNCKNCSCPDVDRVQTCVKCGKEFEATTSKALNQLNLCNSCFLKSSAEECH